MFDLLLALVLGTVPVAHPTPPPAEATPPAVKTAPAPKPVAKPAPRPAVLEGIVNGPDGKPVGGALVVARSARARWDESSVHTRTSADGRFRLTPGTPPFNVRVDARGLAGTTIEKVGAAAPLTVSLVRGGVIEGMVKDAATGQPIGGAQVSAASTSEISVPSPLAPESGRATATSDGKGRFRLEGIGRGRHSVSAVARGYAGAGRPAAAGAANVEILLVPGGSITGVVRDVSGRPVAEAIVGVHAEPRGAPTATGAVPPRSDAEGRFELFGVPAGTWTVLAVHPEYAPGFARGVVVERGADSPAEVVLESGTRVVGRLVDPDGKAVAGRLHLQETDGFTGPFALSELIRADAAADGRFVMERVLPGAHVLAVSSPGLLARTAEADVRAGDKELDLGDVVLEGGAQVRGRVRDRAGAPIADAHVLARPQRGRMGAGIFSLPEARTGEDGTFAIAVPSPSAQAVTASAPGYGSDMKVVDPEGPPVEFALAPAGVITGQVVDEAGRPVESFTVNAERAAGAARSPMQGGRSGRFTPADGQFTLEDVPEGEFVVDVRAEDQGRKVVSDVRVSAGATTALGKVVLSGGGTLRGVVVDSSGAPVAGATVGLRGATAWDFGTSEGTLSGAGGGFEFKGLEPGTSTVTARHPSYAAGAETVEIDPSRGPAEVRVVLSPGGRIAGTVRGRDGSVPRGGMVIAQGLQTPQRGPSDTQAAVSPDGTYAIERVPPGRVRVTLVRSSGAAFSGSITRDAEVAAGETTVVDFSAREVLVSGRLTRGGLPLPGVRLTAWVEGAGGTMVGAGFGQPRPGPSGRPQGVTGEDGGYEMTFDSAGTASIRFESPDGQQALPMRRATIPDAETHTLDFEFPVSAITGVVVDRDTEQPVPRAAVSASSVEQALPPVGARVQAGADGRFTLALDPGEYVVTAGAEGYATEKTRTTLADTTELTFALERGDSIAGRVVDRTGRPVQRVLVTASSIGEPAAWLGSDGSRADGTFALTGLRPGSYAIFANEPALGYAFAAHVPAGRKDLALTLRPWVRARVRVASPEGGPAVAARIAFEKLNGTNLAMPLGAGISGPDGVAEVRLPAGTVDLLAVKEERTGRATVTVADGETPSFEITLEEPQTKAQ